MKSIYGTSNLRIKTFYDDINVVERAVNEFLEEYDGNIVDVMIENDAMQERLKVVVLYRISEEV